MLTLAWKNWDHPNILPLLHAEVYRMPLTATAWCERGTLGKIGLPTDDLEGRTRLVCAGSTYLKFKSLS